MASFRAFTYEQQLAAMRAEHGVAADVTERSMVNYPGDSLREIIRQSGHPHNIEPLLLTLARPANGAMRRRFAGASGEVMLITRALGEEPLVTDLQARPAGAARLQRPPNGRHEHA